VAMMRLDSAMTPSPTVAYDANGNTLADAQGRSFTWDFENRLTQVVNPGVGTTTFKYDPFGRRIQKSGPLGSTNYLYDGLRDIEELDSSGNILARYTQGKRIDEPLAELRQNAASYYEQDGLGSVTSLSNSSGALTNTYSYDSFGRLTASTGTITNPFQYAGREFDQETGIYYNRARYLDQNVGRFVSADPIHFRGGMNFYAYARNNPVGLIDPLGYQGCSPAQWAQSPNACAGAQDPNAPYQGPDGLWYNVPDWHPDPRPSPPSSISPSPIPPPQPSTCDHSSNANSQHCREAIGETVVGVIGTVFVGGAIVASVYLGPEMYEGLEGLMTISHLTPLGITLVPLVHGGIGVVEECF
jgi:RHS repeat-associated protein